MGNQIWPDRHCKGGEDTKIEYIMLVWVWVGGRNQKVTIGVSRLTV